MILQPAYILHRYPFQENHYLLKIFTKNSGLISAIAKNAKKPKSPFKGLTRAFTPILISYSGKGDVLTIRQIEPAPLKNLTFCAKTLPCAFYLNELLLYFLHPNEAATDVYDIYETTLIDLSNNNIELPLRLFELYLLNNLGIGPNLTADDNHQTIEPNRFYEVTPAHLPKKIATNSTNFAKLVFLGQDLIAINEQNWNNPATLKAAKRLTKNWLQFYTKGKTFKSRELLL